jgi:CO/xanthine dehydrogenase FAD-binding subunit
MTAYHRPSTLEHAVATLRQNPGACLLAGGTDLVNDMQHGLVAPTVVVDTADLAELRGLALGPQGIVIGAATSMRELLRSGLGPRLRALQQSGNLLGGRQIQAVATIGGNLCQASPAAEVATPLLVHAARVTVAGSRGLRTLDLADLFAAPRRTTLGDDELLVDVRVGGEDSAWTSAYCRIELRRSVDIAIVSASVALDVVDQTIRAARVAIGAAGPVPFLVPDAARRLEGVRVEGADGRPGAALAAAAAAAGEAAMVSARPISDVRASADYRRAMVGVVVQRAVVDAAKATR